MKEKYNIGEVSDIFKIPKSTLRYWDSENLIQMDRNEENEYREYNFKQIIDISDIVFYRSLNIPIAKMKKIFDFTLEEFDNILYDTQDNIEAQLLKLEEIKKGIILRRSKIKEVELLQGAPYSKSIPDISRMIEFDISHFHKTNQDDYTILISRKENKGIQYGIATSLDISEDELNGRVLWENNPSGKEFIQCLLRISVDAPEENNLKEHLDYIESQGYQAGQIIGRYLITAMDGIRYDYYKVWIELVKR